MSEFSFWKTEPLAVGRCFADSSGICWVLPGLLSVIPVAVSEVVAPGHVLGERSASTPQPSVLPALLSVNQRITKNILIGLYE